MNKTILLTGGAGFIGSHTAVELINSGYDVIIVDNFTNSNPKILDRLKIICNNKIKFCNFDINNNAALRKIFKQIEIYAVIHFAAFKSVSESVRDPIKYYKNNIGSTTTLIEEMSLANIKNIVFSSSATVYGSPDKIPITEKSTLKTTNPYGYTKLICENILHNLFSSDESWKIAILRYFNPIGAHQSGLIGEDPFGVPNNLMPYITQVASGNHKFLNIYGNDYNTIDGTGVRDYIHVVDLAQGHIAALNYLEKNKDLITVNLGTGEGISVKQLVDTFSKINKIEIPFQYKERRAGDVDSCYADTGLADKLLGWKAKFNVEKMCADSWRWQLNNPSGYQ